jgi:hypothetical protein
MADIQVYPREDVNHASPVVGKGTRWDKGAKSYRYVQVEDMNLAAGDVVELSDTTGGEVTKDRAGGSSLGRGTVAGVALATVTDANYGVVQVGGVALVKAATAAVGAAGTMLAPSATDGLVVAATTATKDSIFAVALGNSTATTSGAGLIVAKIIKAL